MEDRYQSGKLTDKLTGELTDKGRNSQKTAAWGEG